MAICYGPSDFIRGVHEEGEGDEVSQLSSLDVIVMSVVVLSRSFVRLRFISLRSICILPGAIVFVLVIHFRAICMHSEPTYQWL